MTKINQRFPAAGTCMILAGGWFGFCLSQLPKMQPYKLLNIAGIIYGLLGIVVLAEYVMANEALKRIMVTFVAGAVLWASSLVPLGMLLGAALAYVSGHPSAASTAAWAVAFVALSVLPLSAVDVIVVAPTPLIKIDVHGRHQVLGLVLLLGGGALQLAAAVFDLII